MNPNLLSLLLLAAPAVALEAAPPTDWAGLERYAEANARLERRPDVVFLGNSITELWYAAHPAFFDRRNYAARGISGQVTAQMLARLRADVVDLHPHKAVILAGTNDLAENNGPIRIDRIAGQIYTLCDALRAAGIEPVLCSLLPAAAYPWRPDLTEIPDRIRALNRLLHDHARQEGIAWVEFYEAMADDHGALRPSLTSDGVHPTAAGFDVMEDVILKILEP